MIALISSSFSRLDSPLRSIVALHRVSMKRRTAVRANAG